MKNWVEAREVTRWEEWQSAKVSMQALAHRSHRRRSRRGGPRHRRSVADHAPRVRGGPLPSAKRGGPRPAGSRRTALFFPDGGGDLQTTQFSPHFSGTGRQRILLGKGAGLGPGPLWISAMENSCR